jgi:hypothetical protein
MSVRLSARRGRVTLSVVLSRRTRERASGEIPGISHRTMQVADPSGPSTTGSQGLQRRDGACLDGYSPRYADAGIQTRITTVTGSHATRITPRRHCIAPAGIEPATSGSKVQRPSPEDIVFRALPRFTRQDASGDSGAEHSHSSWKLACQWLMTAQRDRSHTLGLLPSVRSECREQVPPRFWTVQRACWWKCAGGTPMFPRPDG